MDEQRVFDLLQAWAGPDENIRAMLLTSSRTNPQAFNDALSDYDIEAYVRDWEPFLASDDWLEKHFGPMVVRWPRLPEIEDGTRVTRLVLFTAGFRIDFQIFPVKALEELAAMSFLPPDYDYGYEVLLDKDGLTATMVAPTHTSFMPSPPTEAEYLDRVNAFWWDIHYVAKALWRDEIVFAKYMLDCGIRADQLEPMLIWYIGLLHNWAVYPNKHGRWFKRYLDVETWRELETTYAAADSASNWKALFNTLALFRRIAEQVAHQLGFSYPMPLDKRVTAYLHEIKDKPR